MIRNAKIRTVEGRNAAGQYVYEGRWMDDDVPCTLRVAPRGRGYDSYLVDDVVMVALPYGDHTAGRIIGLFESGGQLEPEDEGNTEIHARGSKDLVLNGEAIKLGVGASKGVAREDDDVQVTIPALSFVVAVSGGVTTPAVGTLNAADVTVTGRITSSSATAKAVD